MIYAYTLQFDEKYIIESETDVKEEAGKEAETVEQYQYNE
jgi:hypothetical protein